jgi:formate hydrogenlyase subunit 5
MNQAEIKREIEQLWKDQVQCRWKINSMCEVICTRSVLPEVCKKLFIDWNLSFAGIIVEEGETEWLLRYCFYGDSNVGWFHILFNSSLDAPNIPSIVQYVHAADWQEREAEDLFELAFEGHPQLGNFVLHDEVWAEGIAPMRRSFNSHAVMQQRKPNHHLQPVRIVREPGSFLLPIGPKYSGVTESVQFLLETVGEDVIRAETILFYKWRAIEKLAEGKQAEEVLLLSERFSATTAFAHGLAFCQAVESICQTNIPVRAKLLRVFLAELERLRHHAGAIQAICESTGLAVGASQAAILEEDLLRISCELTGHRYLFGLLKFGGLLCDLSDDACLKSLNQSQQTLTALRELEKHLYTSSSFLDRLEDVGIVSLRDAQDFGLLGPVARASGIARDLRQMQPYLDYQKFNFDIPMEKEGDGYARLRILFAETKQSVAIMEQASQALTKGPIYTSVQLKEGAALGWTEAPRGGAFHWVRLANDGKILRYRIIPPSFANWHGFYLAVEDFAFQDFPIILSTFDLSVAENDR